MAMPADLVLVRHGQSEANLVQRARKRDPDAPAPHGFDDRHDATMRLSVKGREQATITGAWLHEAFPDGFDRYYVSPLARTMETAGHLRLGGNWTIDDRWRERDWGEYGAATVAEQEDLFRHSTKIRNQAKWYWRPPGGESLATGVRLRFEDILGTMHRELDGKAVIAVTHGEMIETARFVLERMLPEEWQRQERDPRYKVPNCHVLHYSRRDPTTGEIGPRMQWRRSVCVHTPYLSWSGGEWQRLDFRTYRDEELLEFIAVHPNLFP